MKNAMLLLLPTIIFVVSNAQSLSDSSINEKLYTEVDRNTTEIEETIEVMPTQKQSSRFIDKVRAIGRKQAVGVRGKLMCGGGPVKNATVKLWDNDMFDPDDLIAETNVNVDGTFELSGFAISITAIDPQLRIYHDCRSPSKSCRRKVTFTIPDTYINKGITVSKWFDLGTANMEIGVKHKEERHCK